MPPSSSVSVPLIALAVCEQLRLVEDREVVVVGRREVVARPQECRDLGLDPGHLRLVGDADADRPDVVARDEVLADDPDRHHDLVVGVLEAGTALGLEDADQPERQAADGDLAADRAGVELEVVRGRRAEHRDAQVLLDRRVGQERALPHVVGPDRGVVGGRADDRGGRRLAVGADDGLGLRLGGDAGHAVDRPDRRRVLARQRRAGAAVGAGRRDRQQVRAQARQPLGDARRGPLPDADQGDHRRDADDHAQHRQGRAEAAGPEAREREPDELEDPHATSRPSRMCTWRPADAATSASWVMRTMVLPARLSSRRSSSTSWPDAWSRLPVGSSARIRAGSVTSARATATRCCWPPDSSEGSWWTRSPRPSRSSASVARRVRSARPTPW